MGPEGLGEGAALLTGIGMGVRGAGRSGPSMASETSSRIARERSPAERLAIGSCSRSDPSAPVGEGRGVGFMGRLLEWAGVKTAGSSKEYVKYVKRD